MIREVVGTERLPTFSTRSALRARSRIRSRLNSRTLRAAGRRTRTERANGRTIVDVELFRFSNRIGVYLALMDDRYPSTDEQQAVALDYPYPDASRTSTAAAARQVAARDPALHPLFFLWIASVFSVIIAWFAILFTGRYPRGLFEFVDGVFRWTQPRRRLRLHPGHRRVPALPAQPLTPYQAAVGRSPEVTELLRPSAAA